jgi:hypothetical protein
MSTNIDDLCLKMSLKLDLKNIPDFCEFRDGELSPRFDKDKNYFGFPPTLIKVNPVKKSCITTPRKNELNNFYSSTNTTPNTSPILLSINMKRKLIFDENLDVFKKKTCK